MAFFGNKKREQLAKEAEREREEVQQQRRELQERLLGNDPDRAVDRDNGVDDSYRDMRGIDDMKELLMETAASRRKSKTNMGSGPSNDEFVCSGCDAIFKDSWDLCPRCGGKVTRKSSSDSQSRREPASSLGPDFDLSDLPDPFDPGLRARARESPGSVSVNPAPLSSKKDTLFSKEVLEADLFTQNVGSRTESPGVPEAPAPGPVVPPSPVKKVKKVKRVVKKTRTPVMGQQHCSHCKKTLTKSPSGGWKFCVFCGEKL
jgi:hypothetical protein